MGRLGGLGHTSLRSRVTVLGAVSLGLVVIATGLCGLTLRSWDRSLQQRGEARIASAEVSDLRLAYSDQETGIRGYLLTGDQDALEPYRQGVALARAMGARLRSHPLVAASDFVDQLEATEDAAERWQIEVAGVALGGIQPNELTARSRFDAVRDELDGLDRMITADVEHFTKRSEELKRATFTALIVSAAMALLGLALVVALFRRWVTRPLASISEAARRLSEDDSVGLPSFDNPELQAVTDAIGALQGSLARERDRALTAYEGLEQSALLALHVRSELASELGDPPPGWVVGSQLVPAEGLVAGDCFDMGLLDQQHLYVIMIDVTGHGAVAALDALKAKTELRAALRSRLTPGAALERLSRHIIGDERADLLTAVIVVVDVQSGECRYANGGHPAPLLTNGCEQIELAPTGPLIGAFPAIWSTDSVVIEHGWTLLFYTDGVTEALGTDRDRFGDERVMQQLQSLDVTEPVGLVAGMLESVEAFRQGPRNDDVTLLALHRSLPDAHPLESTVRETDNVPS